jgi:hypothetical protein
MRKNTMNKKIAAIMLLLPLLAIVGSCMLTSVTGASTLQLGQTVKGQTTVGQPANVMVGSRFTATSSSTVDSISVYITNPATNSMNVKCAIYKDSDKTLLASTEQQAITGRFSGWQTFDLTTSPTVTAGSTYSLVVWFQSSGLQIFCTTGTSRQSWYAFQSYGNFPTGPYTNFAGYAQENFVYSLYATLNTVPVSSATPTATSAPATTYTSQFGQTVKGTTACGQPTDVMVGSRFTATANGFVNSVSAYITNVNSKAGDMKCAIYRESDKTLLASTDSASVSSMYNGWVTLSFSNAPQVTAGSSYSVIAWFGTNNLQIYYSSSSTLQSWYAFQSYGNFPTGPYSSLSNYNQEDLVYSLYATVSGTSAPTSTPSTPTAPPTTTTTPTPTPTPTPTTPISSGNGKNLAPIPSGWDLAGNGLPQSQWFAHVDNSVLGPSGNPSIRLDPDRAGTERDIFPVDYWQDVKPGDHIVFSIWIKTSSSSLGLNGNSNYGGRIGIDFYDPVNGDQYGINRQYSVPTVRAGSFVPWGTSSWTQFTYDVTVPAGSHINGIIPWIQVLEINDQGQAWFADAQLYINP